MIADLRRWLPEQRWFGAGGRQVLRADVVQSVQLDDAVRVGGPALVMAVVDVLLDGDERRLYQVPVAVRRDGVRDAADDPEAMSLLLRLVADGRVEGDLRFVPERPAALAFARRAGLPARRHTAEQSNTSVVFGDRFIVKLFRRLSIGVNPDLEVHRRLAWLAGLPNAAGDDYAPAPPGVDHVATLLGAIEGRLDDGPVTFGIVQRFAPGAVDGWTRTTAGVTTVAELGELGAAVARVHKGLVRAFGVTPPDPDAARQRMADRLEAAAAEVPQLRPMLPRLRAVLAAGDDDGPLQRVHGDLHLGQVVRSEGRWLLIDFEGEPAAPIADRIAPASPWRDVAGMLRSLDYAAAHLPPGARQAFLDGYTSVAGVTVPAAGLRAHELDKAVYETVYETRNRPGWVGIPLAAVRRFHDTSEGRPADLPK